MLKLYFITYYITKLNVYFSMQNSGMCSFKRTLLVLGCLHLLYVVNIKKALKSNVNEKYLKIIKI